jgi:hypothetical protein
MSYESTRHVSVYPVGWLGTFQRAWRALVILHSPGRAWRQIRQELRYCRRQFKHRNWRALRQTLNGYLAEHEYAGTRCGHGWTRRRALRDLERHLAGRDA